MDINSAAIIGAGTMGSGIAQWMAQAGCQVFLCDAFPEQADKALTLIHASWDKLLSKKKFSADQIKNFKEHLSIGEIESIPTTTDLVIEAIIEREDIKQELFQKLDQQLPASTIFASNTSSIPIDRLALNFSKERKARFLGIHFFNPATIMKLVELIKGTHTDEGLINGLYQWFDSKAKIPAICQDSPGFIVNRVARSFYGESLRIVNHLDRDLVAKTDKVLREVGGFKMGPFELMDLIGIDVNYSVTESVWKSFYHDPRFAPHPLQRKMVESGLIGKKAEGGFYE